MSPTILLFKMFKKNLEEYKLTGQTKIKESNIIAFPSYKLMSDDERHIVDDIIDLMRNVTSSAEKGFSKRFPSLIPRSNESDKLYDSQNIW